MEVIRERYLELLAAAKGKTDLVKVITGMRRIGKSTLMRQFRDTLDKSDNVVFLNLDLIFKKPDPSSLRDMTLSGFDGDGIHYVFIDEIQDVDGWELVIAELVARGDCDIYITGSNSKMLSSELATKISGRYVEIDMYPLSFEEYLKFYPGDKEKRFDDFLQYGSLPVIEPWRGDALSMMQLGDIFNTVLVKDVLAHVGSKDVDTVISIARYLFSNIGNVTNVDNISKELGVGYPTVQKYVGELLSAHVFEYCERYDIVGKKILRSKGKYYATDLGMRGAALGGAQTPDPSRPLENAVFMELRRRYPVVRVGSYRDSEVDFTVSGSNGIEYYQVSYTVMAEEPVQGSSARTEKSATTAGRRSTLDRSVSVRMTASKWSMSSIGCWISRESRSITMEQV
jgi:Predicted ATPase (AAA+ superfamily)